MKLRTLIVLRRLSQTAFVLLFFVLFVQARLSSDTMVDYSLTLENAQPFTIQSPVDFFFRIDPLLRLTTLLAGKLWLAGIGWVIGLVAMTVVLGRVFCGFICPFGTIHHAASLGIRSNCDLATPPRSRLIKYAFLAAILVSALLGLELAGILDPLCLLFRSLALSIFPGIGLMLKSAFDAMAASDIKWINLASYAAEMVISPIFGYGYPAYQTGGLIGLLFLALVWLNRFSPRFWCRVLCPLGALLGLIGRCSRLALVTDQERCSGCGICQSRCPGAARSGNSSASWNPSECLFCLSCMNICPKDAISLRVAQAGAPAKFAPTRRAMLSGMVAGLFLPAVGRVDGKLFAASDPALIRPPGSLDEIDFLAVCARCGLCMKICPTNAINPAWGEAGLAGFWTPLIIPKQGYCELSCTLCSQLCPTGAIRPITPEEKKTKPIRIGSASIDRGRCLPWSGNGPCIVCEEVCPTSPKAIVFDTIDTTGADGESLKLKLPKIRLQYCIGCGICENKCPISGSAAVRVIAAGETRNPRHGLLL